MKTFEVILTENMAIKFTELFTGDIKDISTEDDRKRLSFKIEDIECTVNEAFEAREIK